MAALIKMPFGLRPWVGPRNHLLDGVDISHGKGKFCGERAPRCKVQGRSAASCAKTAEPIEMPFGLWTWVDQMKHVLHGGTLAPPGKYD